jgi:hypothetical protein
MSDRDLLVYNLYVKMSEKRVKRHYVGVMVVGTLSGAMLSNITERKMLELLDAERIVGS